MKKEIEHFLVCPLTGEDLELKVFKKNNSEIIDGVFLSSKSYYPIINGIPRFVENNLILNDPSTHNFFIEYDDLIKNMTNNYTFDLHRIRSSTSEYFGAEWDIFEDWGWYQKEDVPEHKWYYEYFGGMQFMTEKAFPKKCLFTYNQIKKSDIILDAGCGNGRYTFQAAKTGATVFGVDIGYGIKSAYKHMAHLENVHIIQADLFNLPFKESMFDKIFSNGVLMHTGDAYRAFKHIAGKVKINGEFVAHLYHVRNPIFEIVDHSIRFITTKISVQNNLKFARFMAKMGRHLKAKGKLMKWFKYIEILPTTIHMYDWYSAQIATHHTYAEVKKWYIEMGYEITESKEPETTSLFKKPESLTLKGKRI